METLPPLAVTVTGSWARPTWYSRFSKELAASPDAFGEADREELLRDAIRLVVDDQIRAGAHQVTDGHLQRDELFAVICDRITGLERVSPRRKLGPTSPDRQTRFACTAGMTAPQGLGILEEYNRLTELTKSPIKVTMPGPYALADHINGGKLYRDRDAVAEALMPIVNKELRALVDAGAEALQVDEVFSACKPDKVDGFLWFVQRTVAGARAHVGLRLGFGDDGALPFGPRIYKPLMSQISKLAVQQVVLEFGGREMAEVELLAEIKPPMTVAVGLLDVHSTWVEPSELLADRIRAVLKYVDPHNVQVGPDGGFAQAARHIACAKLTNLAEGSAIVRKERGL